MTKSIIPAGALDRHIAFLGVTGSGKTSATKAGLIEPALEASERVIVIDPTGAYWGLRTGANSKKNGYRIYVFGGDHGDYPLMARDAELLAEAFGTSTDSAIFDTSLMTVSERTSFFTQFAEAIRRKNRGPMKLVIDEAHLFMPQAGAQFGGATPAMLHAGNNLVSLGRSRGLRITLVSQRPAKLHKDSLTQVQSLVAMRLVAPQDRKAIREWVADQADASKGDEIIASLPSLKPGEAWIWAPQDGVLERARFPLPKSYDSSRAPSIGDADAPKLSPIDLDKLADRLKTVEIERKSKDPKELNKRITELEGQLRRAENNSAVDATPAEISPEERQALINQGFESGVKQTSAIYTERLASIRDMTRNLVDELVRAGVASPTSEPPIAAVKPRSIAVHKATRQVSAVVKAGTGPGDATLPKGERAILICLAQRPNGCKRPQLTALTGFARSTRDSYIQRLGAKAMVDTGGERVTITDVGRSALGEFDPLPTGNALHQKWLRDLPDGESKILGILIQKYPDSVPREKLRDPLGFARSTSDSYIQRLSAKELVDPTKDGVTASADLFE